MEALTEAVGMLASLTSFLLWLPQGARVWRARHDPASLQGIALTTQVLSLTGNVLWATYAVLIQSFWVGAPVVVNAPIAVMTITVLLRARRADGRPADRTRQPVRVVGRLPGLVRLHPSHVARGLADPARRRGRPVGRRRPAARDDVHRAERLDPAA